MNDRARATCLLAAALALGGSVSAGDRSQKAHAEFQRQQLCPSTGQRRGACPGYLVDHVIPLCAGGPDTPANMQWLTAYAAKVKDRAEVAQCRTK